MCPLGTNYVHTCCLSPAVCLNFPQVAPQPSPPHHSSSSCLFVCFAFPASTLLLAKRLDVNIHCLHVTASVTLLVLVK